MPSLVRIAAALALAALAPTARAQQAAPGLPDDPRAPRYREIERGVFASLEFGWMGFTKTDTAEPSRFPSAGSGGGFASGPALALSVGVELGPRLSLSVLGLGTAQQASVSYGSFSLLGAGADARLALVGLRDSQKVERLYLYVHARGAWFWTDPHGLFGTTDVLLGGGVGLEYFTRLRHFSLGLALDGVYALDAKAPGIAVLPSVRYSF